MEKQTKKEKVARTIDQKYVVRTMMRILNQKNCVVLAGEAIYPQVTNHVLSM